MVRPRGGVPPPRVLPARRTPPSSSPSSGKSRHRPPRLDPTLSGPHAILADTRYLIDHDWPGAEQEFRTRHLPQPERRRRAPVVLELPHGVGPLRRGARRDRAGAGARPAQRRDPDGRRARALLGRRRRARRGGDPPRDRDGSARPASAALGLPPAPRAEALRRRARRAPEGARARAGPAGGDRVLGLRERARRAAPRTPTPRAATSTPSQKTRYVGGFPFAILTLGQKKHGRVARLAREVRRRRRAAASPTSGSSGASTRSGASRASPTVVRRLGIPKPR